MEHELVATQIPADVIKLFCPVPQRQVKSVTAQLALAAPLFKQSRAHVGNWDTRSARLVEFDWAAATAAKRDKATVLNCIVIWLWLSVVCGGCLEIG